MRMAVLFAGLLLNFYLFDVENVVGAPLFSEGGCNIPGFDRNLICKVQEKAREDFLVFGLLNSNEGRAPRAVWIRDGQCDSISIFIVVGVSESRRSNSAAVSSFALYLGDKQEDKLYLVELFGGEMYGVLSQVKTVGSNPVRSYTVLPEKNEMQFLMPAIPKGLPKSIEDQLTTQGGYSQGALDWTLPLICKFEALPLSQLMPAPTSRILNKASGNAFTSHLFRAVSQPPEL